MKANKMSLIFGLGLLAIGSVLVYQKNIQNSKFAAVYADDNVASITSGTTVTEYDSFSAAVTNWTDNTTLTLLNDVTIDDEIEITTNRVLDLNGFGIRQTGYYRIFTINSSGDLTIKDSTPTRPHAITLSDYHGTAVSNQEGTTSVTNGNGTAYITGGYLTGGDPYQEGGAIRVDGGKLTLESGTIIGNVGTAGGAIACYGDVKIKGGAIVYNKGSSESGGIHCNGSAGVSKLTLSGGLIENNYTNNVYGDGAGGVFSHENPSIYLEGNPIIRNNYAGTELKNLIYHTAYYGFFGEGRLKVTGELTEGAYIGITSYNDYSNMLTASDDVSLNDPSKFHADKPNFVIYKNSGGQLQLIETPANAVAYVINDSSLTTYSNINNAFTAWNDGTTLGLLKDLEISSQIDINSGVTRTLDLNGCGITQTTSNRIIHVNGGTFNLYDNGSATHYFDLNNNKKAINVNRTPGESRLSIEGGYLAGGHATNGGNPSYFGSCGGGVFVRSGTFNMYGGNILGCDASGDSGAGVEIREGLMRMYGGTILYNQGSGICLRATGSAISESPTFAKFEGFGGLVTHNTNCGIASCYSYGYQSVSVSNMTITFNGGAGVQNSPWTANEENTLTISDSVIEDNGENGVYSGGGTSTFTLSGNVSIKRNKGLGLNFGNSTVVLASGGKYVITDNGPGTGNNPIRNLYVQTNKKITLGGPIDQDSSIGITMQTAPGAFTDGWSQAMGEANPADFFFSDVDSYGISLKNGEAHCISGYVVTFDVQGHGTAPDPVNVNSDATFNEPASPTEEGWTFDGWYKEEGCLNAWDFANDTVTEDITLYAKWVIDEVTSNVIKLIDDIGDVTYDGGTDDSKDDIEAAKAAYDALTPARKEIVDGVNKDVLDKDVVIYEHVDAVAILIKGIPEPSDSEDYYDAIELAKTELDKLSDEEIDVLKTDANFDYEKVLEDNIKAEEVIKIISEIGDVTYKGGTDDSKDDIKAAKDAYDALTDDQKAIVDKANKNILDQDNTIYDHVDNVAILIKAVPTPSDSKDYYDAVEAALEAYDALTDEEKAILHADISFAYEKTMDDNAAAKEVIDLIDDIGDVTYKGGTDDSKDDIEAAQNAYNSLDDNQKAIVDKVNKDELDTAKETYDNVDETVKLIEAIGEVNQGGDNDSKDKIELARKSYNALSDKEKTLVDSYKNTGKVLKDDEAVYNAMKAINEIGEVSLDDNSKEAIDDARAIYDSLTDDQKLQLGRGYLNILAEAEMEYDSLTNTKNVADVWVIILLIIASLTLIGGIWFLFILLRKKDDDKDDDNNQNGGQKKEPVKVMSVGGLFSLFILTTNIYGTAPWIIFYIIASLAVLVWASVLTIFILKKKKKAVAETKEVAPEAKETISSNEEVSNAAPVQAVVNENEEDEEESVTVTDENGNIFNIRFIKSFTAKLIQSPEETKKYYEELKNEVLSYKKTNSRISWHYDAINSGRNYVLKFAIRGKTLCVYFPLNADDYNDTKYKVEKVESKKYEDVPCLYRIKNDRRLCYAKELIAVVAEKLGLEKGEEQHEVYSNLPYEPNKPLIARGLIKELKVQVNKPAVVVLDSKVNADGDEIVTTKDSSGNIFEIRYIKSFTAKLSQSEDIVKDYYTILKNHTLSYKKANSRVSWHFDSINVGRNQVMKFSIRGKTLCLYFALNADDYLDSKYKVEKVESKKFEDVPCLYRIKNDRRCEYAKDLIDEVMKKVEAVKGEEPNEDYHIKYESTKALLAKGLIKEVKSKVVDKEVVEKYESITVEKADKAMSDDKAEASIVEENSERKIEGKKEIINIDTLSDNFNNNDEVTLESLKEKKLISSKVGYVKVLARGALDKKLIVSLNDYSLQAVKMIVLMGGQVKKIK